MYVGYGVITAVVSLIISFSLLMMLVLVSFYILGINCQLN